MLWIRPANIFDAPVLGDLHAASWRDAYRDVPSDEVLSGNAAAESAALWTQRLSRPVINEHVFLAGMGYAALGFVSMFGDQDDQWGSFLNNLHVHHAHQRLGIGTRLINVCARLCIERYRHAGLYLWVTQTNARAQRFYLRHGARNCDAGPWPSPEARQVGLYRFAWPDVEQLRQATSHHSA